MSDENLTPRPLKVRRQRPYNTIARTHRYRHENGLLNPAEPACNDSDHRRAVSSSAAIPSLANTPQTDSAIILHRQPSLKHRLLNRMVSGFSSKPILTATNASNDPISTRQNSRDQSRRSSESSASNGRSLIDLDGALAFFPTPPTSVVSTPKTERSFKSPPSPLQTHRDLSVPQKLGTLTAEIKVVPCHDREKLDYSNAAVVEIHAKIHETSFNIEMRSQRAAVDVVVVVDNSLFNCPALLMTGCEVASHLGSLLDSKTDRIATVPTIVTEPKQKTQGLTSVNDLIWVNPKKLKAVLDSITISTTQPDPGVLIETVKRAQHLLRNSERIQSLEEPSHETFGHLVILTADTSSLWGESLKDGTIQIHVMSTGIPKDRDWDKVECNGWKMCLLDPLLLSGGPLDPRAKRSHHPRSLHNKLQALIRHARSGQLADCLTDVIIDLEPQAECTKERVLGRTKFSRLQIGETKTVVVSLIPTPRSTTLDHFGKADDLDLSALNTDDELMAEIGHMLGFPKDRLLTVNLTYKHSSMPKNTFCTASTKCLIQMHSPSVQYRQPGRKQVVLKGTALLHQRLAEYYAAYYPPRDALSTLWREFGEEGCRSACPTYITALADDLKYQARISERIAIENSPQKPFKQPLDSSARAHINWSPKISTGIENQRPVALSKESDSEPYTPEASQTQLVEQLGLDDASKIWSDLRHLSKGELSENRRDGPLAFTLQEPPKRATETTLRSPKSLGECSLRSLVERPQRTAKSTVFPPWT